MKIAIIGSREYPFLYLVEEYVNSLPIDTVIVSGGARGVDKTAENAAKTRGMPEPIIFPYESQYGKAGGHIRNTKIIDTCDRAVAFWDEESTGSLDSINKAIRSSKLEKIYDKTGVRRDKYDGPLLRWNIDLLLF